MLMMICLTELTKANGISNLTKSIRRSKVFRLLRVAVSPQYLNGPSADFFAEASNDETSMKSDADLRGNRGSSHHQHRRASGPGAEAGIASNFKRKFSVAYFNEHKELPPTHRHVNVDPAIKKLMDRNNPGSIRECYKIPNDAWDKLIFKQCFTFEYYPQISDLLDDKAITPDWDHVFFAEDALRVEGVRIPAMVQQTRLILEILSRPNINLLDDFYAEVEKSGRLPTLWAVIQLMAKERELKIDPRVFSFSTFECRMMASACERNISSNILRLFKHQSITQSRAKLRQKMDSLINLPETDYDLWVRFHMDLEQWNYMFRSQRQALLPQVFCDQFGVGEAFPVSNQDIH
ncbi:unnamed protein product [Bemisia tabaci]|uniref:RdRp catalytic domain-containing protein n=1 Tax=Bemisia tabaci TaxID=7038 RepID=A0A9P0F7A7_BEMTA|nr:unnamed protein product [Bemisia tabaci]